MAELDNGRRAALEPDLGVEPLSRLGWGGMIAIVLGGIVLNGLILSRLAAWMQHRRERSR